MGLDLDLHGLCGSGSRYSGCYVDLDLDLTDVYGSGSGSSGGSVDLDLWGVKAASAPLLLGRPAVGGAHRLVPCHELVE